MNDQDRMEMEELADRLCEEMKWEHQPSFVRGFIAGYEKAMEKVEVLQKEVDEQCRLNGMGAQRELKLMTQLSEARARFAELEAALTQIRFFMCGAPTNHTIAVICDEALAPERLEPPGDEL